MTHNPNHPLKIAAILVSIICLALLFFSTPVNAEEQLIGGLTPEQALIAGERMYREGLLPSGEPMEAWVQGDIPVDGTMFSCENCHLRSGLGSLEGNVIVYPTNAAKLYIPLHRGAEIAISPAREKLSPSFQGGDARPAYTDETLAIAIWEGVNPSGKELLETMPRYPLDEKDMEVLIYYLKSLSAEFSPGVTEKTIHMATIVTEGIDETDRKALVETLQAFIKDKNSQNRHQSRRSAQGPWFRQERFQSYRDIDFSVWELTGPPETWSAQLETYQRKNPAFALLGGLAEGSWEPIHRFCEAHRIPCIFPLTEQPAVNEPNWYTLYYSKGPYQEGETVAKFLRGTGFRKLPKQVVQIVSDSSAGRSLAAGFRATWGSLQQPAAKEIFIGPDRTLDESYIREILATHPGATFLLWLEARHIEAIGRLARAEPSAELFVSGKLLGDSIHQLPDATRSNIFLTYPERLPEERKKLERMVVVWLEAHNLPVTNLEIQSKVYFIGWMLSGVLKMMLNEYYQDYFLDILDMMNDEYFAIVNYPRVSFGQGQRFAVKGCYIVQLEQGPAAKLVKRSDWVVH